MNKEELLKNFLNERVTIEYKDHLEKATVVTFLKNEEFKPVEVESDLFCGYFEIFHISEKTFTDYDMSVKQSNLISFEDFLQIAQITPPTKKIFVLKIKNQFNKSNEELYFFETRKRAETFRSDFILQEHESFVDNCYLEEEGMSFSVEEVLKDENITGFTYEIKEYSITK